MKQHLKYCIWSLALAAALGIGGSTRQAVAANDQEQQQREQDYSRNKRYQQGLREGRDDMARNRDHSKKRHFKKDEDQKAYEYGYQKGHSH
jgi:hypothetical protein